MSGRFDIANDEDQLGRRWRPALMAFFLRRVRQHDEAEDLTHDVLARLLRSGSTITSSPEGYVFQVASNLLKDRARRLKVRADYKEFVSQQDGIGVELLDPLRIAIGRSQVAGLIEGLSALPERTRLIFILYRVENIGLDLIAENFSISKSAVKKHIVKAMTLLSTHLRDMR